MATETQDETRKRLLEAILTHVAFDGWSDRALRAGAADVGVRPEALALAFPGGPSEVIGFFSAETDAAMLVELEARDLDSMKIRERVTLGVRLRLERLEPHKEAVRRGLSYFTLPQHGPLGLDCLYRTVSAIWYAAGDRATDYNFYSKRLLLAGVYSTTLVYWLDDKSEEHQATWAFLDRRIGDALRLGGGLGKRVGRLLELPDRLVKRRCVPQGR